MNSLLFALYDQKAKSFGTPFSQPNMPCGIRQFADAVNSDTAVGKNPGDFDLYVIAEYDWEVGILDSSVRDKIANGADLVK